jgi:hypothetical protein
MASGPAERLCAILRGIVALLERGDHVGAAAEVAQLQALIATLPRDLPEEDLAEAKTLLSRYRALGEELREKTHASMARLGAARRAAVYGRKLLR